MLSGPRRLDLCECSSLGYQIWCSTRRLLCNDFADATTSAYAVGAATCCTQKLGLQDLQGPRKFCYFFRWRPPCVQTLPAVDFTSPTAAKVRTPNYFGSASQELSDAPDSSHTRLQQLEAVNQRACDASQSAARRQHSKRADSCETRLKLDSVQPAGSAARLELSINSSAHASNSSKPWTPFPVQNR